MQHFHRDTSKYQYKTKNGTTNSKKIVIDLTIMITGINENVKIATKFRQKEQKTLVNNMNLPAFLQERGEVNIKK